MATTGIAAASNSIPSKKEGLRKAFDALQTFSSSLASFTLKWKDLDDHLSSIERSIESRFNQLESKTFDEPEPDPRPVLKSLCVKMDAKGLRAFIIENRDELDAIRGELNGALRVAPDPAALVLDAMDGFYPSDSKGEKGETLHLLRRTCLNLLEKIQAVEPDIKPSVRERAKELAFEWKGNMRGNVDNSLEVLTFFQLLMSYGLASVFQSDELVDLLVFISRRKQTIETIKSLGLDVKVPDFIEKLSNKGKQLDAVKFVYAFDQLEKFPPVPLLKAYLRDMKKAAEELRKRRNNSGQSQHDATLKNISSLRNVIKAIEEYKLEAEFPPENLVKRLAQLEQQKAAKKQSSASYLNSQKQQQGSNKRLRPSTASTSMSTSVTHPVLLQAHVQTRLDSIDRASYLGLSRSYDLLNRVGAGMSGFSMSQGGNPTLPTSYLYSSEALLASSELHERPPGGYSLSDLPSAYGPALQTGGHSFLSHPSSYGASRYP